MTGRQQNVRFGIFEIDFEAGELRRHGYRLILQPQPFKVLAMLLERPGQVVWRADILARIWPATSFGDIDQALNKAVSKIREVLGDSSGASRFVETIPRRGYRFIASTEAMQPPHPFVAVLPFRNIGPNPEKEYFSEGLAEEILGLLSGVEGMRVLAGASMRQFQANSSLEEIRERVAVSAVLSGTIRHAGGRIRLVTALIDATTGEQIWAQVFDRELKDIFMVQAEIATAIVHALRINLAIGGRDKHLVRCVTSVEAYDRYLNGVFHMHRRIPGNLGKALSALDDSIAIDPEFAPAYTAKAEVYGLLWFSGQAKQESIAPLAAEALAAALRLDPYSSEALALSAFAKILRNWDWRGAELAFERALSFGNGSSALRWRHASFLLAPMGKIEQALEQVDSALRLDPLSALVIYVRAQILWCGRQYSQAAAECEHALMIDPAFKLARLLLGCLNQQTGKFTEAIAVFEDELEALRPDTRVLSRLASAYALVGRRNDSLQILSELTSPASNALAWDVAWVHLSLHDAGEAYRCLERGIVNHDPSLMWLKVHPDFDSLRGNPRFEDLVRRIGLGA